MSRLKVFRKIFEKEVDGGSEVFLDGTLSPKREDDL